MMVVFLHALLLWLRLADGLPDVIEIGLGERLKVLPYWSLTDSDFYGSSRKVINDELINRFNQLFDRLDRYKKRFPLYRMADKIFPIPFHIKVTTSQEEFSDSVDKEVDDIISLDRVKISKYPIFDDPKANHCKLCEDKNLN